MIVIFMCILISLLLPLSAGEKKSYRLRIQTSDGRTVTEDVMMRSEDITSFGIREEDLSRAVARMDDEGKVGKLFLQLWL